MKQGQGNVVCTIYSPMNGRIRPLTDVPDMAFAKKMIGDGIAIEPYDGEVLAPTGGTVRSVFETRHAIVFENERNYRVLLHFGIESMRLKGKGFKAHVQSGQTVEKGDKLLTVDLDRVKGRLASLLSPVVVTYPRDGFVIHLVAEQEVAAGEPLFEIMQP